MTNLQSEFFKNVNYRIEKCFFGDFCCNEPSINAHSISNSLILEQIAQDDHVIGIKRRIKGLESFNLAFEPIGRNHASTFQGLCANHDKIFAPIDTQYFNPSDSLHLNLYNYRALLKSFHECIYSAGLFQKQYETRRKLEGKENQGIYYQGQVAIEKMFSSWMMFRRKIQLEDSLEKGIPFPFVSDTFELEEKRTTLAASSYFSINDASPTSLFPPFVFLNIIPCPGEKTKVAFSYFPEDAEAARRCLYKVLSSFGDHKKYELSKVLLRYSSNFYLSPREFSFFGKEKVKIIQDYFFRTTIDFDYDTEDFNLMLFGV